MTREATAAGFDRRAHTAAGLAAAGVCALGLLVLAGWAFDIDTLTRLHSSFVAMMANTALCFVLAGVSLWLQRRADAGPTRRDIARACAAVVTLVGAVTLVEYVAGVNLGIDELLVRAAADGQMPAPGRMAPATAAGFVLSGLSLLVLDRQMPAGVYPAHWLALSTGAIALLASLGYLYGVAALYAIPGYTSMALHTAAGLLLLASGTLAARPDRDLVGLLGSDRAGGVLARRLLPAAFLVPAGLGWLRLAGERAGLYGVEFGLALFASANVAVFAGLVWITARALDRSEQMREWDRAESEAQMRRANADLEARVHERTAELEAANGEMEAFTYSVSHDLRAPLRAIDGYSRILVEDHAGRLGEEGQRVLGVVRSEAQRMDRLITDLLALSRLGRQSLVADEIDMTALAAAARDEALASEPGRAVQVTLQRLPPARGTAVMIRQVWVNLLANAVKFTRGRDGAAIEVGGAAEGAERVYYVRDNGVGFDMRHADKLFHAFERLHSSTEFEGTGIGLALVHRIVTRHGGRVWAESTAGAGATFYFSLPERREPSS